eukprot:CAMPEP_0198696870 /NCGR_PEP_ID=MMETSP1468-20131203/314150_1 /TAXON_ID=1461545 /ORGANISM="Mantoniella sp, Strain CCMP1436" /LENGTH=80 /DNA_ID=CAMNT_0044453337 /DNA_START=524 /DNA_END=762 /DNA_ORIENTATION=-
MTTQTDLFTCAGLMADPGAPWDAAPTEYFAAAAAEEPFHLRGLSMESGGGGGAAPPCTSRLATPPSTPPPLASLPLLASP